MRKFRTLLIIVVTFFVGVILTLAIFVLVVQHLGSKFVLNYVNNELPGMINKNLKVKDAEFSLLTAKLSLDEVSLSNLQILSRDCTLFVDKLKIKIDLSKVLQGKFVIKKFYLIDPKMNVNYTEYRNIKKSSMSGGFLPKIEIQKTYIKNGIITADLQDGNNLFILSDVDIFVENLFLVDSKRKVPVNIKMTGKLPPQKNGVMKTNLSVDSFLPKLNFSGTFEVKNISMPYFYSLFQPTEGTTINDGTLKIISTIHCVNNWLTIGNIVSIDKLDVNVTEKKLFGIPADLVTEFFRNNDVTFDLPVNGNIYSLRCDFSTAATQVMMKALQEKLKDDLDVVKISEKLGRKIGKKLGRGLTDLLYHR